MDLDWSRVLAGQVLPESIRLYEPVIRVSVSTRDQTVNTAALLAPQQAGGVSGGSPMVPPRVDAVGGAIELGEHTGDDYRPLAVLPVTGSFTPKPPYAGHYTVKLQQTGEPPATAATGVPRVPGTMLLEGEVALRESTAEMRLHNFDLSAWPSTSLPRDLREIWEQLDMRGKIAKAVFRYSPTAGPEVELGLSGVAMNALVPADRPEVAAERRLSLQDVTGGIRIARAGIDANLSGLIEDLPCQVYLRTEGTDLNSALRCEILSERFTVSQSPDLLPFAPEIVRERFANFSGPTAIVDARILIERGPPTPAGPDGKEAPLVISGSVAFENGKAAFDGFPYPVEHLSGLVTFSDAGVKIVRVNGDGSTGASVFATGRLIPPMDGAGLELDIMVLGAPIDDVLYRALQERGDVLDNLFNREHYSDLVERGLVLTSEQAMELTAELEELRLARTVAAARAAEGGGAAGEPRGPGDPADVMTEQITELERRLQAPRFDLGGKADLLIAVRAGQGHNTPVYYQVDVALSEAGILPRRFPLPIQARDVLIRIDEKEAVVLGGYFKGLRGGTAEIQASVALDDSSDDEEGSARPHVVIDAHDIPIDDLLVNAVPDELGGTDTAEAAAEAEDATPEGATLSAKELLQNLHIDGMVNCQAEIRPEGEDDTSIDVLIELRDLAASPASRDRLEPEGENVMLAGATGTIRVTDERVQVMDLTGTLHTLGWADGLEVAGAPAGRVEINIENTFSRPESGEAAVLAANIHADDLDVSSPVHRFIELVAPSEAARLHRLKMERAPTGLLDAAVSIRRSGREPAAVEAAVTQIRNVEIGALGGRLSLEQRGGEIGLVTSPRALLRAREGEFDVSFNGEPAAGLRLDGALPLEAGPGVERDGHLDVRVDWARLESPFLRALVQRTAPDLAEDVRSFDPAGEVRADLVVRADPGAAPASGDPGGLMPGFGDVGLALSGRVRPRTLELTRGDARIRFARVDGEIVFDEGGGELNNLEAIAEHFWIKANGGWSTLGATDESGERVHLWARLSGVADQWDEELSAVMPAEVREVLTELDASFGGPISLSNAELDVVTGSDRRLDFSGVIAFTDASVDPAVPITDADGELTVTVRRGATNPAGHLTDLSLEARRLKLADVPLTDVSARLMSGDRHGSLVLPHLAADCLGGRLVATGVFESDPEDPQAPTRYQASATVAGARFAPLLAVLAQPADGSLPQETPGTAINEEDESRGRIDATFAVEGVSGDAESRRGIGSIRVADGNVIELPLLVPLIQLSNLQVPIGDELDYAQAEFNLVGQDITFEQIAVMSSSVSILGTGSIKLPELALRLRFTTQSANRVPLLSDLFELVRNEILTTRVTGTLREPSFETEVLGGTRRMLASIFGDGETEDLSPLSVEAEEAARRQRDGRRRMLEGANPTESPGQQPRRAAPAPDRASLEPKLP